MSKANIVYLINCFLQLTRRTPLDNFFYYSLVKGFRMISQQIDRPDAYSNGFPFLSILPRGQFCSQLSRERILPYTPKGPYYRVHYMTMQKRLPWFCTTQFLLVFEVILNDICLVFKYNVLIKCLSLFCIILPHNIIKL